MIISCPACSTRYVVPDSSIGIEGRTVRCAKCRHSWYQDGPALELAETEAVVAPGSAVEATSPIKPETSQAIENAPEPIQAPDEPPPIPESRRPEFAASVDARIPDGKAATSNFDEAPSSFEYLPPFRPRRNPAKMWTAIAIAFASFSIGAIGVVGWYGLPDWAPFARPTFAEAQTGLVLDFPRNRQDRRTLPNGTEFFGASGTIRNVSGERRSVPAVLIVLRDNQERIVYSWEVAPPKRELAPGESMTVNEAVTDVPKSAKSAEIGWKPG
jgi:predicted Zn finger-like uncharacterized protein